MAVFHIEFRSEILELQCGLNVILPQKTLKYMKSRKPKYQTLWLLHGLSDDQSAWQRWTSIERYVDNTNLAVVMPAVGRSFYSDMVHGLPYWSFLTKELPVVARWFFPLSAERADNFVAGLSMGGYGAFKLALSYPDRYAAAASLSGALDMSDTFEADDPEWVKEMTNVWGGPKGYKGTPNDLMYLSKQLVKSGAERPMLYQWCGTKDFLYAENIRFRKHAEEIGLEIAYSESAGDHQWKYWDRQIQRVLKWLPLK
jgi:putative tributyrin esterase